MPPPRTPSLGSRIAAVAMGVAVGLLLGELALRIARPAALERGLEDVEPFVAPDPTFGWTGRPNLRTEARLDPEFRHAVATNSRGLRNRETPYDKGARTRILCLGDSFTWGLGVESADAFPSLLERGLPGAEVVNAGVIGWGTAQEWLWLEAEGYRYAPDTLVLGFFVNDFWDNAGSTLRGRRPLFALREGELVLESPPSAELARRGDPGFVGAPRRSRVESFLQSLRVHSWLARAAQLGFEWLHTALAAPPAAPVTRASLKETIDRRIPPAPDVTFALLKRVREFCAAHAMRLVVLIIPGHEDVSPSLEGTARGRESREAYDTAVRFCRTLEIDAVELRPRLLEMERSGSSGFHRGDIHLNAAGHRAASELLLERLRAR